MWMKRIEYNKITYMVLLFGNYQIEKKNFDYVIIRT